MTSSDPVSLALLLSPAARGAYFAQAMDVARAELSAVLGLDDVEHQHRGGLDLLCLQAPLTALPAMARLSFVQAILRCDGDALLPLESDPDFTLPADFVFGAKYRGKTNEHFTQLLINVGLAQVQPRPGKPLKLLDPMAGRGTTLLWALRYGLQARGIEPDKAAPADLRQNLRKWSKLHRVKHQLREGSIGKPERSGRGHFLEFIAAGTGMKLISGDARDTVELTGGEKFDLIVSDLPYGVQHFGDQQGRDCLPVIETCASPWCAALRPGGVVVLGFNSNLPKRAKLLAVLSAAGFEVQPFSAPHRMSESIVRDVVVARRG